MQRKASIVSHVNEDIEPDVIDAARKKRIKAMTAKKLDILTNQNMQRQTAFFGETQHKFMKTTNDQGGVVEEDEEDPDARRTLYQQM